MNTMKRKVNKYLRQVASLLPCGIKEKKRMLGDLRSRLYEFLESNPEADFSALEEHFGTSQEIAASFVGEMGTGMLLRKLRLNRRILIVVVSFMVATFLSVSSFYLALYVGAYRSLNGYLVVELFE